MPSANKGHTHTRTHRTASPLIACSIFNIFMVWEIMTLGAARTTRQMMFTFVLTDAVRCRRRDYELRVFRGFVFFVRVYWGGLIAPLTPLIVWVGFNMCICVCVCVRVDGGWGCVGCFAIDPQQIRCPTFQLYKHRDVNAEKPTGHRHREEVVKTERRHQQQ